MEWTIAITIVAALFISGLALLLLVRNDVLTARPWNYLGLAFAGFSTIGGMALAIAEADITSGGPTEGTDH